MDSNFLDKYLRTICPEWSDSYDIRQLGVKPQGAALQRRGPVSLYPDETFLSYHWRAQILAKVEHNRWVMEQLLLGIRPVDRSYEGKLPINDKATRSMLKSRNIHPDLISNEMLGITQMYDEEIAKIIPLAMSIAKKLDKSDD